MQKDSIKREQSQAGLSFAERKNRRSLAGGESNFRPQVKNKLLLLLALLMTAATGAWAQEQWDVVWDFTAWSTETVTALKADAAASKLEGWSDVEKKADAEAGADPTEAAKDNCFWFAGTVNEDGSLSANGAVIKELKGLKFNSDYAAKRSLAIAVNYPSTSLGDYAGGAYLWLGGSKQTCFTIPGVKAGSKITIEVESNKTSAARGIGLYKNSYAAENLIGEQFTPTTFEAKTWEIAEDCNVVVYNTNSCHIYTIKVKAPADGTVYTKAVAISELKVGDILAQGASITGESSDVVNLDPNRSKVGNDVVGTEVGLNLTVSFGTNGTINNQYAPVTESGQDGDAWVVTNVKNQFGIYTVNLAGILMTGSTEPVAATYTVSMKDGVKDADKWTVKVGEGQAQALPIGGLKGDGSETVTLQYNGRLKVKGVKATSDAAPAKTPATVTTAPTGAAIVGVGKTTALVSGGAADGGTLMYAVTTTNTKPTTTDGFSATVPTAQTITASGKVYVWYYVKGDDTHSDSEIAATAIEVPVADIIWDVTNVSDLEVPGSYSSYEKEGVTLRSNGENEFAMWIDYADPTKVGIAFEAYETGGFNFTAPAGKAFTKIEMKAIGSDGWNESNLGTGWAYNSLTVTWTGSAASTVGLLTGADYFEGARVKSIAFYLSE